MGAPAERESVPEHEERTLSYERVYPKERVEAHEADPFEGYAQITNEAFTISSEEMLEETATRMAREERETMYFLWNPESGETWVHKGFFMPNHRQGYQQKQKGFTRFDAEYRTPLYRSDHVHFHKSHDQWYEASLGEVYDEISEPVPTDNPDFDQETAEAVIAIVRKWARDHDRLNGYSIKLDSDERVSASPKDIGVQIPELGSQMWMAITPGYPAGQDMEAFARRIGHNSRVYRQAGRSGAGLLRRTGHHSSGHVKNHAELVLVPIEVHVG